MFLPRVSLVPRKAPRQRGAVALPVIDRVANGSAFDAWEEENPGRGHRTSLDAANKNKLQLLTDPNSSEFWTSVEAITRFPIC
jgi:hypothetical protein